MPIFALLAVALLVAGCGSSGVDDEDREGSAGGGPTVDSAGGGAGGGVTDAPGFGGGTEAGSGGMGGSFPGIDELGRLAENPVDLLVADPDRSPWDQLTVIDSAGADDYAAQALACYEGGNACAGASCSVFASCCVGTGLCCEPVAAPPIPSAVSFSTCGDSIASCEAALGVTLNPFGPGEPTVSSRGLVPGGSASAEAGVVVGEPTDLGTTRVAIDVEFTAPLNCGVSCLESAGVTFTGSVPGAVVDADLGLLLSGSRREVNLMIGNAVTDTFAAQSGATWTLSVSPVGRVEVLRNGTSLGTYPFSADGLRSASIVVFGRNLNGPGQSAAVQTLRFEASLCDVPGAWDARTPLAVSDEFGEPLDDGRFSRSPTIASDGSETRIAYERDQEIFWGRAIGPGSVELIETTPAVAPSHAHDTRGVFHPALVFDGNDWHAFYTARDGQGVDSIGHGVAAPQATSFITDPGPTLAPLGDEVSLDAPTVTFREGLWVLVVRATLSDGTSELRAHYSTELGTGWARIVGGNLEAATRNAGVASEVTGPALVVHNSAYQLYVARRSGTRWRIDLLLSDELLIWKPSGEALPASTDPEAFDSVGGRAPDAISLTDRIDLVYEGQSGVSFVLGRASRPAPSDSAPDF